MRTRNAWPVQNLALLLCDCCGHVEQVLQCHLSQEVDFDHSLEQSLRVSEELIATKLCTYISVWPSGASFLDPLPYPIRQKPL